MEPDEPGGDAAVHLAVSSREQRGAGHSGDTGQDRDPGHDNDAGQSPEEAVGALYRASALGLIRLAYVMLGDRPSAEDVVQEAFCGLYRRWDRLELTGSAMSYLRASVLNGCRSVLRHRAVRRRGLAGRPLSEATDAVSAEAVVLGGEERGEVIRALSRLPHRQRETIVLRFYSGLSDEEIARVMGVRRSTVRSTTHRALDALGRALRDRDGRP